MTLPIAVKLLLGAEDGGCRFSNKNCACAELKEVETVKSVNWIGHIVLCKFQICSKHARCFSLKKEKKQNRLNASLKTMWFCEWFGRSDLQKWGQWGSFQKVSISSSTLSRSTISSKLCVWEFSPWRCHWPPWWPQASHLAPISCSLKEPCLWIQIHPHCHCWVDRKESSTQTCTQQPQTSV